MNTAAALMATFREAAYHEKDLTDIAPPLGLAPLYPGGVRYVEHEIPFTEGDTLVATTDGIGEARDADGQFYPATARLSGWSRAWPQHIVLHLYSDLRGNTGGLLQDDAAALVLQRPRHATPASRRRLPNLI